MNPLLKYPGETIILPPQLCGSIERFALMAAYGHVIVDNATPFNKRFKSAHRISIVDTQGPLHFTVPIAKPASATAARWNMVTISSHSQWWSRMVTALESAYGRTPFFEFYIDRLLPPLHQRNDAITNLDMEMEQVIAGLLGIPAPTYTDEGVTLPLSATDLRRSALNDLITPPYWQIRAHRFGFIPQLSILDLIFNLGPEAPLYLPALLEQMPR